jgi:hypothetical protein
MATGPRPRFDDLIARGAPDACWLWLGYKNQDGYGKRNTGTKGTRTAHRMAWENANEAAA